jgi:CRISPR-associated protein Csx10
MKAVNFLLHTKQPILATSLQGDPNSDVSYPYVPGSMLRGALIGRYLKQYPPTESDILDNSDVVRLFFDGTTRYLNAYLWDQEQERRSLPIPNCLCKSKGEEYPDYISNIISQQIDSPKQVHGFCVIDEHDIRLHKVNRRINIHNQRDRKLGRGIERSGAVFRYDAIDAEQTFQAVILCDRDEDVDIIKSLFQREDLWMGGSQSAGYGHVAVQLLEDDSWNEVGLDWEERSSQPKLTVTLLSNLILRDDFGQPTTDPQILIKELSESLGTNLKYLDSYANVEVVGGFNRKWGLPLPQVLSITAGSVFVFKKPEKILATSVHNVESQGIGERKIDGFGRISINWIAEIEKFQVENISKTNHNHESESATNQKESNNQVDEIAQIMARRILRQKLDDLLLKQIKPNTPTEAKDIYVSNSQLSRLMNVTRQSLSERSNKPLYQLIGEQEESTNLNRNAREQFKRTKINDQSLDKQIRDWLANPQDWINKAWGSDNNGNNPVVEGSPAIPIAGYTQILNDEMSLEYTFRLIMAISRKMKAMKEKNDV